MKKVLIITPHLSTGGQPQYLLKKIETLLSEYDFHVVEWENITGGVFVVQRDRLEDLLNYKFYSLNEDKREIYTIINHINPDVIHFEEIPETFIPIDILENLYSKDRSYNIVSTTHSSFTDPKNIKYTADKFILVSDWSKDVFNDYYKGNIPCDVWEYPIEYVEYNKDDYKKELEFDSDYKHVLHVGLFTPGKNQKHIINLAKKCLEYNVKFHFVGNQAMNFAEYWEPLMQDFPNNCIFHGERNDVDKFYKASDLFYFPSLFELSPISLKEALSYKLPIFTTKLPTYSFNENKLITYITEELEECKNRLIDKLSLKKKIVNNIPILHILTDITSDREIKSMQSITKLEDFGYKYIPIVSKRYTQLPPSDSCQYPEKIDMNPGGKLTPSHYGCYLGHMKAFNKGISFNSDYIIIFECDTLLDVSHDIFNQKVKFAIDKIEGNDLLMFSFGFHNNTNIIEKGEGFWVVDKFYGPHPYLIPKKSYDIINNIYETRKWNVTDLFFADNLSQYKTGIYPTPITKQAAGESILDKIYNNERY